MAPTLLEKAEADRVGLKAQLDLLESMQTGHATHPLTLEQVEELMEELAEARKELKPNYAAISLYSPKGSDLSAHKAAYEELARLGSRVSAGFHGIKSSFPPRATPSTSTTAASQHGIKLPPLELPKFSGNLQEWVPFRDLYTTAIHNSSLTKVEKLTQLKALLTGEAARQVRSLILSEANYDIAWQSLTERYENNRELLFSLIRRLMTQPTITTATAATLRSLVDTSKECIRSLEVLSIPTQHWDAIILYIIFSKLDSPSRELWEQSLPDTSIPSLTKMYDFVEQRARALAASSVPQQTKQLSKPQQQGQVRAHHVSTSNCKLGCSQGHPIFRCEEFLKQTPKQRNDTVKRLSLCINCLWEGHMSSSCSSKYTCRTCGRKHHTMLHVENARPQQQSTTTTAAAAATFHVTQNGMLTTGVLATAKVLVRSHQHIEPLRALIDGGSTNTHITETAAKRLKLQLRQCYVPMSGHGNTALGAARHITTFTFSPHFNQKQQFTMTALVVQSIGGNIPHSDLARDSWSHLHSLQGHLADPEFHLPGSIDILLGTDIVWTILGKEKCLGQQGQPSAIQTSLGWLVAGANTTSSPVATFITQADLDSTLRRFWEQESVDVDQTIHTPLERACESHFEATHKRDATGRFTVSLPFKTPMPDLGASRRMAVQRFLGLENKFFHHRNVQDPLQKRKLNDQWSEYRQFMHEYEELGHMELVPHSETQAPKSYYIPHHSVVKESSTTTKLRVVFDASAGSTTGKSLNDCMMVGPQLQDHIWDIMLRFRLNPIAFTADIAKMYRQIRVSLDDINYQRIVWRDHPNHPLKDYRLLTVTYGTASAPYLAVKCLQQLAKDEKHRFPAAFQVTMRDFYVDDVASTSSTVEEAKTTVKQLIDLCMSGGMELRKWTTNSQELLDTIPEALRETSSLVELTQDSTIKTLGVYWNPSTDKYSFKLTLPPDMPGKYTKRIILSQIAKIYDPLGWLSPVIIVCKIFMQDLWKLKHNWDDKLPESIQQQWTTVRHNLMDLEQLEIPRCVVSSSPVTLMLIGCSDASTKALSAALYIRATYNNGTSTCHLLTSKTKVAPVKLVTVARLELNAAVLLSELIQSTLKTIALPINEVRAFTDSSITFYWVNSDAAKWKLYIRRRVQAIQENVPNCKWYHIPGNCNPADCASRGLTPSELRLHSQWWNGVPFFDAPTCHPDLLSDDLQYMEVEAQVKTNKVDPRPLHPVFIKYSSFNKLVRVIAFTFRFINNFSRIKSFIPQQRGPLTVSELSTAHNFIIRQVQQQCYSEISMLSNGHNLHSSHQLLKLKPFIASDGLLRVGGRLYHANITMAQKHPLLLPKGHHITNLIIQQHHIRQLHAGPSGTLTSLQQRYWITNGRDAVRMAIRRCVTCVRHRGDLQQQFMGNLPSPRITPSRPFSKVGVDYAGPLTIKPMVRSKVTLKCWLSVFVCLATRATHIEVVSSLSTECFLAALRRFSFRRGNPTDIYSDCGTNFKGADKVLRNFFISQQKVVQDDCASHNISWHFIPPGAPHFGGLWEAGVKSIKHHLVRVMGHATLTYEEMLTLTTQIEGILNSRPLVPASADPSDLGVLTPAHFLIGESITALPEPNLMDETVNYNQRWKLLQRQQQQFWKRWTNEYLTRLQQRPKWLKPSKDLDVGHLVLIKDERLPPLKWKLGRITNIHAGGDGHVRVVTLNTSDGEIKRPIVKLCLLPIFE